LAKKRNNPVPGSSRRRSPDATSQIARDALTAWTQLRSVGGIELGGRDLHLEDRLRIALRPSAPSLEQALALSSTDQLVEAFFGLLQPYVAMFRAILNFFQEAGAREGREAWRIQIDNVHVDLTHFQSFVAKMDSLRCELEVPAIDSRGCWSWHRAAQTVVGLPTLGDFFRDVSPTTGSADVDDWLEAYRQGRFLPFPQSISPETFEEPMRDMAAIAAGSVDIIRRTWQDRKEMTEEHKARGFNSDSDDGFSPRTLAQHESDYRLFSMTIHLAAYRSLPDVEQKKYADALQAELAQYPRRKLGIRSNAKELERILQLPVWQKRHELYAVWVATEIVNAAPAKGRELHHENGRITFAFKETVVATFRDTYPTIRLYAERRSPLTNPIGEGRKNNIQPDFGLWRGTEPHEECGLVVEVKHYKKDAPARFKDVLTDYGRALAKAEILLVSHGPARPADYEAPANVDRRYHVIGDLTANNLEKREELRSRIHTFLKDSIVPLDGIGEAVAFAIDISQSMSPALDDQDFLLLVRRLASSDSIPLVLVDSDIRRTSRLSDIEVVVRTTPRGNSTALRKPLEELLKSHGSVLVITDADGLAGLRGMTIKRVPSDGLQSAKVEVALITLQ
jgi:hypothetical protein